MNKYILVRIVGKNVNNYVKWLIKNKIDVVKLRINNHNELNVIVDYKYYNYLTKYSKTYKVEIIKKYGYLGLLDIIERNRIILLCIIIAIIFVNYLSSFIFSVDIIYNDYDVVKEIRKQLERYDIKQFKRKKSYNYLVKVKNKILADNKDTLEWLEIEESGTKYIVRLVERKKAAKKNEYKYQSIVSKKDAIISSIKGYSGEKVKSTNDYVKKGDVIISGVLTKPDGTIVYEKAKGMVMGEVWYQIEIDYPLLYQEEKLTGKNKQVIAFYFLNHEFPIFPYKKYKHFNRKSKILIDDNFIPFKIVKEKLYEVEIKEEIYTYDQAVLKAKEEAIRKLKDSNKTIVNIKDTQVLTALSKNSFIKLRLFISAIEDITDIIEIVDQQEIVEN